MRSFTSEKHRPGYDGVDVPANGLFIDRLRTADGFSQDELAKQAGVSRSTIIRMEQDATVKRAHLEAVALVLRCPVEYFIRDAQVDVLSLPRDREWNPAHARQFDQLRRLPNGLLVRSSRLESATQPGVFGRLKIYDLENYRFDKRDEAAEILRRHADACRRVRSPYVVHTYICEPDGSGRYCVVVDEWLEGSLLQERFAEAAAPSVNRIAYDLLLALQSLHAQNVICRGLSPTTVLLPTAGHAVICDLELAKLIERTQTIRPSEGFVRDKFLAPEVHEQGREIGPPADLYSWALTVAWLAGEKQFAGHLIGAPQLRALGMPQDIAMLVTSCLAQNWTKRPSTVDFLLKPVAAWAEQGGGRP